MLIPNLTLCQKEYDYSNRVELLEYCDTIIHGGINAQSRVCLFEDACSGPMDGYIVEIGVSQGASLIALALGSKMANREKVIAIDKMTCDLVITNMFAHGNLHSSPELCQMLVRNLIVCNVRDWVIPILQYSNIVSSILSIPIRLLHIDSSHSYSDTCFEIINYGNMCLCRVV